MKRYACLTACMIAASALTFTGCGEAGKTYNSAVSAYTSGNYEEAKRLFERAVSQGSKNANAYTYLALSGLKLGETDGAAFVSTALEKGEGQAEVLKNAGLFYLESGDFAEAEGLLNKAVEASENDRALQNESRGFLAKCYMQEEKYEEAIDSYTALVKADYCVTAHDVLLGICYLKTGQVYAAEQYFKLIEEKEDVLPEYYIRISNAFRDAGEKKKANQYFEKGLEFCDLKDRNTISQAEYYLAAGKFKKAESSYDLSDRFENRLLKAEVYIENGDYTSAEREYVALQNEGGDPMMIYLQLMKLKILSGNRDAVLQIHSIIRAEAPDEIKKDADWNEIIMYEMSQEYDTAFSLLRDYRKNYPNDDSTEDEYIFLTGVMKGY